MQNWMRWFCPLLAMPQPASSTSRRISHTGKEKVYVMRLAVNCISVVLYYQFSTSREDMLQYAVGVNKGKLPRKFCGWLVVLEAALIIIARLLWCSESTFKVLLHGKQTQFPLPSSLCF
jgi:hypothetical protein